MRPPNRIHLDLFALFPLLACIGCPGSLADPARFADDAGSSSVAAQAACPDIPTAVFATTCTSAGCHTAKDKAQGLDLQSPNVASRLVGVCATEGPGMLVDPLNPSDSVVYAKLTVDPPFGAQMPSGKPPLDDATLACVLSWVSAQQGDAGVCGSGADAGVADAPFNPGDTGLPDTAPADAGAPDSSTNP